VQEVKTGIHARGSLIIQDEMATDVRHCYSAPDFSVEGKTRTVNAVVCSPLNRITHVEIS
jgi:hypothetical protein